MRLLSIFIQTLHLIYLFNQYWSESFVVAVYFQMTHGTQANDIADVSLATTSTEPYMMHNQL
jgi:hypothetical protein